MKEFCCTRFINEVFDADAINEESFRFCPFCGKEVKPIKVEDLVSKLAIYARSLCAEYKEGDEWVDEAEKIIIDKIGRDLGVNT